ncbi:MAG: hypothetical protein QW356_08030 [Candidatus Hadarchaeales archaeon]
MSELSILFDCSHQKVLPITLQDELPIDNPSATRREASIYMALKVVKKDNWKLKYVVADSKPLYHQNGVAPTGAIVYFHYATGSRKHVHFQITKFFLVMENQETIIDASQNGYTGKIIIKNLIPLEPLEDSTLAEIEAEFYNKFGAKPSSYDPVRTLYYYWIIKKVAGEFTPPPPTITESNNIDEEIEKLKKLIEEKEAELEILKQKLLKLQLEKAKQQLV